MPAEDQIISSIEGKGHAPISVFFFARPWELTDDQWYATLEAPMGEVFYEGDLMGGVELMRAFSSGLKDRLDDSPDPDYSLRLALAKDAPIPVFYDFDARTVVVDVTYLEEHASKPVTPVKIYSTTGRLEFVGRIEDQFYLNGIEEADHFEWHRQFGVPEVRHMPGTVSREAYDAQAQELHALVAQWVAATKKGMLQETIDFLAERIANASAYMLLLVQEQGERE